MLRSPSLPTAGGLRRMGGRRCSAPPPDLPQCDRRRGALLLAGQIGFRLPLRKGRLWPAPAVPLGLVAAEARARPAVPKSTRKSYNRSMRVVSVSMLLAMMLSAADLQIDTSPSREATSVNCKPASPPSASPASMAARTSTAPTEMALTSLSDGSYLELIALRAMPTRTWPPGMNVPVSAGRTPAPAPGSP